MKRFNRSPLAFAVGIAVVAFASIADGQTFTWTTVVNNNGFIPPCGTYTTGDKKFNSYSQPSINEYGLVTFRGRSKGSEGGGEGEGEEAAAEAALAAPTESGPPARGVYARDMRTAGSVSAVACTRSTVPDPNNLYGGTNDKGEPLGTFNEFPSFPRIDAQSSLIATRGQSTPVWEYQIGLDETTTPPTVLTTRVGTSGVYANPGGVLVTGASLLGAATDWPSMAISFPQYSVPGTNIPAGTRFDQFPGGATAAAGTFVGFKGNFAVDGVSKTGVFFRDVGRFDSRTHLVANSFTRIPNQPAGGTTTFGSTAPPSAAGDYFVFVGSDIEEAPTLGGVYRAKLKDNKDPNEPAKLETLVGIGAQVPGEAKGIVFSRFGEGLSISPDGKVVTFWGTWGTESFTKRLYCPIDGNQALKDFCNNVYTGGLGYTDMQIPVHQGIFAYEGGKTLRAVAKTGQDGMYDFLFWVFSGAPPGVGSGDASREPPRWRSSAFAAVSGKKNYPVAFKATRDSGLPGIFLRSGTSPLATVIDTMTPGDMIDPEAPDGSVVTSVGIERDGFRGNNLAITASMLNSVTTASMAGVYMTQVPLAD